MITHLMQLLITIKKNIKRLLSSKISASMIIFGPLLMIFLIGFAFQNSGFYSVKVGTYSAVENNITHDIITVMDSQEFIMVTEPDNETCINNVVEGTTNLCIIFPSDYQTERIQFYVDYSRLNLVYSILNKLSLEINHLASQISLSATQDLLTVIAESGDTLNESSIVLESLVSEAGNLQSHIESLKQNIDQFGISSETGISDAEHESLNADLNSASNNLNRLDKGLNDLDDYLTDLNSDLDKKITSITTAVITYNCQNTSTDLTESLLNGQFTTQLQASPNPTCSLLVTLGKVFAAEKETVLQTKSEVTVVLSYTKSMQSEISRMKGIVDQTATETNNAMETLGVAKQNITTELDNLDNSTAYAVSTIMKLTDGLSLMINTFNDISLTDAQSVIKPIKTTIRSVNTKKLNNLDTIFPGIVAMIIMFVGILVSNMLVMKEKTSKAYFRNLILPANRSIQILGTYITTFIITFIQVIIILLIGFVFFKSSISINPLDLFIVLLLSITAFTSIGMFIGYIMKSEETSVLACVLIALILLMFSNLVIPLETLEKAINSIAILTPFNIMELLLRWTLIHDLSPFLNSPFNVAILIFEVVFLIAIVVSAHITRFEQRK